MEREALRKGETEPQPLTANEGVTGAGPNPADPAKRKNCQRLSVLASQRLKRMLRMGAVDSTLV